MQNHGILSVGSTIESAIFWFMSLEKCCKVQLLAEAACGGKKVGEEGGSKEIEEEDAKFTFRSDGMEGVG